MIRLEISKEQLKRANELYEFKALKGSITKGESNIYGAMGEILVYDYFSKTKEVDFNSTFHYDMIIDNRTVDVKTKRTTVTPLESYLCSVSCQNTKQKCDFYFFVRVHESFKYGFLLGYISPNKFYKIADHNLKGDIDPDGNGNWVFKDDCYNLKIEKLNPFKEIE